MNIPHVVDAEVFPAPSTAQVRGEENDSLYIDVLFRVYQNPENYSPSWNVTMDVLNQACQEAGLPSIGAAKRAHLLQAPWGGEGETVKDHLDQITETLKTQAAGDEDDDEP